MLESRIAIVVVLVLGAQLGLGSAFENVVVGRSSAPGRTSPSVALGSHTDSAMASALRAWTRPLVTTQDDISKAVTTLDPLRANRLITELHAQQGRELSELMQGEANFHTWAAHASNEVRSSMKMFMGASWRTKWMRPILWQFADRKAIVDAFTAGNRQVPDEVNRVTVSFVDWVHANPGAEFSDFEKISTERHGSIANFDLVLEAFEDYYRAVKEPDAVLRARHAVAGNLRLVTAEQLALQPELSKIYEAFGNGALHRLLRVVGLSEQADALRASVIDAYGRTGKIRYGSLEFRLRKPLPALDSGTVYPESLRILTPSGVEIAERLKLPEALDELALGGVQDWFSGPIDRLAFIGTLFRQQHNAQSLFSAPKVN